ncbi:MAG: Gfo/Idh/MocA family protein [Rhodospirillales bacterium]
MKKVIAFIFLLGLPLAAQEYKIAVISGLHAHVWSHLKRMLKNDVAQFVGFAENIPELVEQAKKNGVPDNLIFSDYRKMIEQTKPDIVWAFTPTNQHVEVVRYCAPRGVHVMVEKPLSATLKEAREIQALAKKHNILVMTNYGSTWQAANYAIKAAVDAGEIGPVWRLHAVQGHGGPGDPKTSLFVQWLADPVQNGGGALVDFGCYIVNWSLWLKGRPESVYASANHLKPELFPKVEDNATIILNYKDGVAILEASWDLPPAQRLGNEVYGLRGSIVGNTIRKPGQRPSGAQSQAQGGRGRQQMGEQLAVTPLPPERAEPVAYMVNRLKTKQPLDGPSALELNVATMEVLEAAKMSVRTGRAIPLPLK